MLILTMASSLPQETTAVTLDDTDDLAILHQYFSGRWRVDIANLRRGEWHCQTLQPQPLDVKIDGFDDKLLRLLSRVRDDGAAR
jgi:hypothetical protein